MSSHVVVHSIPFDSALGRTKEVTHLKHLVEHDKTRAQKFMAGMHPHGPLRAQELRGKQNGPGSGQPSEGLSIDVSDATVTYMTTLTIGGKETFNLLIDTGSSNTWVGADKKFSPTPTSESTRKSINCSYGSGSFSGTEYTDTVMIGGSEALTIKDQSFGAASRSQGFGRGTDGILGIGPVDLSNGTASGTSEVPTVTDNLMKQGKISVESIGISYNPTTGSDIANGELTFGGMDESKIQGEITYVSITSTSPASMYWGIDQTVTYGKNSTPILDHTAGIVDTGTTLLLIASDAFQRYQEATGATMDQSTGLLRVSEDQYNKMQSLFFKIGGTTFEFTPNAQIWPRSMNSALGGNSDAIYLIVSDLGTTSVQGLDFINGFGWLQRFYSVYDTTNNRVGIANTPNTMATTN